MEKRIIINNLCKSYGSTKAVSNFSAQINKGQCFGLLGANGAGKSTTIECILGTKNADSGSISILGLDPHKDRKLLFQKVAVQFQESHYQNKIKVFELCEQTECLYQDTENYNTLLAEFGLESKKNNFVSDLSGGERQKLFVLLTLIPKPKVIFMDELTTGLDVKSRREIWKYLKKLKERGLTIFLTSHYMDEVETLCDGICILKHGKTVFKGTVEDAISKSNCNNLEDAYLWFTGEEENNDRI